jgi:hypothetical protein
VWLIPPALVALGVIAWLITTGGPAASGSEPTVEAPPAVPLETAPASLEEKPQPERGAGPDERLAQPVVPLPSTAPSSAIVVPVAKAPIATPVKAPASSAKPIKKQSAVTPASKTAEPSARAPAPENTPPQEPARPASPLEANPYLRR